jgi:predicted acetyltransferase
VSDELTFDTCVDDDWPTVYHLINRAFLNDPDDEAAAAERHNFEPARSILVRRGDEPVGHAGILTRRLAIPGGTVQAAHVTSVGVDATARRQGILSRLIARQFLAARAAGEPIAVLWASEGRIYQRFGYGLAARRMAFNADTGEIRLKSPAPVGGRLRAAQPTAVAKDLTALYERVYVTRPGYSERAERHWKYLLADAKEHRNGATALRAVIHETDGVADGYALFRTKSEWNEGGPAGEIRVQEVITENTGAYLALWHHLLNIDLTRRTGLWCGALDEPLLYLVNEPRRLGAKASDSLWLRITDLPAALAARAYATPVDLVLEVEDAMIPENAGRWRLTAGPTGAACGPTGDPADLAGDVQAFACGYLGEHAFGPLASAGLLRELSPGAVATASAAFGWARLPSSIEVF